MAVLPALLALLFTTEVVSFANGSLTLKGILYRPQGKGPFPAVLYNHGSAMDNTAASDALGPIFASRGWTFFMPHRRGQGLSTAAGPYIRNQITAAGKEGGLGAAAVTMVRLLETDHLSDQMAALEFLRKRADVDPRHIAIAGNSFGGILTVLGVQHASYCAGVDVSGGAESWARAPALRDVMLRAVRNARAPVLFIQAENDFDLAPTRILAKAMQDAGKLAQVKIFPAFGKSAAEGHSFAYRGADLWAGDAIGFLATHCGTAAR